MVPYDSVWFRITWPTIPNFMIGSTALWQTYPFRLYPSVIEFHNNCGLDMPNNKWLVIYVIYIQEKYTQRVTS